MEEKYDVHVENFEGIEQIETEVIKDNKNRVWGYIIL